MRNFLFILLTLCALSKLQAQDGNNIPVGTWRIHAPYLNSFHLAIDESNGKVYSCSGEGLLYADPDGSVHGLTLLDGLTSMQFNTLGYDATTRTVLIAYKDGNLDILRNNTIINVNDIFRSTSLTGSKSINHILTDNGKAYLAADFGVSVLDLNTLEIIETWKNISAGSATNPVYSTTLTTDKDSVFIATQNGVLGAKLAPGINLMDYNNWKLYGSVEGLPNLNAIGVASYNGIVYSGFNQNGIYALAGSQWIPTSSPITSSSLVRNLRSSSQGVLICADYFAIKMTSPTSSTTIVPSGTPADCNYDALGTLWISDQGSGLSSSGTSGNKTYKLNGPDHNSHFKLHFKNNNMISCAGAYEKMQHQPTYNNLGYYEF